MQGEGILEPSKSTSSGGGSEEHSKCSSAISDSNSRNLSENLEAAKMDTVALTKQNEPIFQSGGPENSSSTLPSKRSFKKLAKKAKYEENKKFKRIKTKLKKKEKKPDISRKLLKRKTMKNSNCLVNIVIDLSFDDLMIEKDLAKCIKQIHRCYSVNRRLVNPIQLHVTSFNGESAKMMEKHDGFDNWDVSFHKESFDEIFPVASVVYLTSESDNVIEKLEDNKYYVIGGLVDHNSKKGLCHQIAVGKNISHARLPIDEFVDMKVRKVLSIDHVFEIMANVCQGVSWQDSFMKVIPPRKQAALKNPTETEEDKQTE